MISRVSWLAIACAVLSLGVAQAQTQVLVHDFEDGTQGTFGWDDGGDPQTSTDTPDGSSGSLLVPFDEANSPYGGAGFGSSVRFMAAELATFTHITLDYKTPSPLPDLMILVEGIGDGKSGGWGLYAAGALTNDGEWHTVTIDLSALQHWWTLQDSNTFDDGQMDLDEPDLEYRFAVVPADSTGAGSGEVRFDNISVTSTAAVEGEDECDVIVNGGFDDGGGWTLTNLNTDANGVIPSIDGGQGLIQATGHGDAIIWQIVTLDASTTYDFSITWGTDNTDIHYWAEVYVTSVDSQVPEENVGFDQDQASRILADGVLMPGTWGDATMPQTLNSTVSYTPAASGDYVIGLKSGQSNDAAPDNTFTTWFDDVSMTIQGCTPAPGPAGTYIDGSPWAELGSVTTLIGPSGGTAYSWSLNGETAEALPNVTANNNVLTFDPVSEEHEGLWTLSYDDGNKTIVELTHFLSVVDQVPVSGLLGLGALVAACGLGGARMLRRKTQR